MITPNQKENSTRTKDKDDKTDENLENSNDSCETINTIEQKIIVKNLMSSIIILDMSMMENVGTERTEDLAQHDSNIIENWEIVNDTTKGKLSMLINHVARKDMIVKK